MAQASPMQTSGAQDSVWTVEAVLRWITGDFASRGIDSPRLEAELLVGLALGTSRIQVIVERDRPLMADELARIRALVTRRRKREPLAYILGRREFYGREFLVDRRVLIPRPDTETLVEVALDRTQDRSLYGRALDLCTGSGNVAISFALQRPTWQVDATDISADALDVARMNALRLGAVWNVRFRQGDLFAPCGDDRYDLITANPPYLTEQELREVAPDIRDHEPRIALVAGSDGLDVVRRIVAEAGGHLAPAGVVALEIGCQQGDVVADWMTRHGLADVRIHRDLAGRQRVVSGCRGQR